MSPRTTKAVVLAAIVAAGIYYFSTHETAPPAAPAPVAPAPAAPVKPKQPAPNKPCPRWPHGQAEQAPHSAPLSRAPQLGGLVSPDGTVSAVPLPPDLKWPHNIASRGLGLCSFRSLDYAARWQNVPELVDLPERMRSDGVAGGGYPEKLDHILHKYAPNCPYWNDTSKALSLVAAAVASERLPCVDYSGRDPHYHGPIAHCVTVVACDLSADWIALLDNNYPALDEIVWMGTKEFSARWAGWCYGLLAQTPGICAGLCSAEKWTFTVDDKGGVNYGLEPTRFPPAGSAVLNGQPSTVDAIIAAIGPAMMPKIEPHIDSKISFEAPQLYASAAAVLAAAFLIWAIKDTKGSKL